jgi:hypothetical protein
MNTILDTAAFPPGGPAAIVLHAEGPVAFDLPRIGYLEENERTLKAFARATRACETFLCNDASWVTTPQINSEHDLTCGELSQSHLTWSRR